MKIKDPFGVDDGYLAIDAGYSAMQGNKRIASASFSPNNSGNAEDKLSVNWEEGVSFEVQVWVTYDYELVLKRGFFDPTIVPHVGSGAHGFAVGWRGSFVEKGGVEFRSMGNPRMHGSKKGPDGDIVVVPAEFHMDASPLSEKRKYLEVLFSMAAGWEDKGVSFGVPILGNLNASVTIGSDCDQL